MSNANLQKMLWVSICILSLFTLTVLWTEITDKSSRPNPRSNYLQRDPLRRLPDDVLNDGYFLRKLRNLIDCNYSLPAWPNTPKPSLKEPVYVITPTYPRALQIPELTRMGQTLKHVDNLIWIVAEDAVHPTNQVLELLNDLGVFYQYLLTPMPTKFRVKKSKTWPKGVENRNKGIDWIVKHVQETGDDSGVFYFADDDNTYDIRLFEEIRKTKRVSLFPVGFLSNLPVSTPLLNSTGNLVEFYEGWIGKRSFPVDMAAFAVNVRHFIQVDKKKPVRMDYKRGYEEDSFLKKLGVEPENVEFLADNCTKIYVWHTKTQAPSFTAYKPLDVQKLSSTNLGDLLKYWCNYVDKQPCDFASGETELADNTTVKAADDRQNGAGSNENKDAKSGEQKEGDNTGRDNSNVNDNSSNNKSGSSKWVKDDKGSKESSNDAKDSKLAAK